MFQLSIDLDTSLMLALLKGIPGAIDARRQPMRGAMQDGMAEVMRFQRQRFRSASGGDGTWKALSPKTKYARAQRQHKASGSKGNPLSFAVASGMDFPILLDTEALESGLFQRGASGHFIALTKDQITEGVAGGKHPNFNGTIGELAVIHHFGTVRVPARPVMGDLDNQSINVVAAAIAVGVDDAFNQLASGLTGPMTIAA